MIKEKKQKTEGFSSNFDPYQSILQKTYDKKIPFSAHWELTYKCNLSCMHCYATNASRNELTSIEIENTLEQLAQMGCLFLTFTGGEVFCRNDLLHILQSAKHMNFAIQLFTNGTLISEKIADTLAEIGLLSIEMSLYSTSPDIHDKITGTSGSHEKTINAIRLCRKRNINTTIKCPLLKYNISEYDNLRQYAEKIGAKFVFDFILVPADDGSKPMIDHGLSEQQIFEFLLANAGQKKTIPAAPNALAPICGAGSNVLCISPDGNISACLAFRKPIGNLRKAPIQQIWNSSSLDSLRASRYSDLVECRTCDAISYCPRCAGNALAECGNMLNKYESACTVANATKRAIEKLISGGANAT